MHLSRGDRLEEGTETWGWEGCQGDRKARQRDKRYRGTVIEQEHTRGGMGALEGGIQEMGGCTSIAEV